MERFKFYTPIAVAVVIGLILQGMLILADCRSTPGRAAAEFAEAFYRIDPAMASLLCSQSRETAAGDVVEKYIQKVAQEARERGFGLGNMRYTLYHVETETHQMDDKTAEVKLSAKRRVAINPLYALVAKIFMIGATYEVNERLTVVKENSRWKVCGNPFALAGI